MGNKRVISSDMFSDDKFMFLDDFTRILWVGLITVCADDQGRFQNNEALIKSQVFPADKKSSSRVHKSLKELEEKGMVFFYEKDGKKLAQIPSWWKHQRPSWASPSLYTPPDGWVDREKYHSAGNKIVSANWDSIGGFCGLHSVQDRELLSQLPTGVSRLINEIKSEIKSESESESERNAATSQPGPLLDYERKIAAFCDIYAKQFGKQPKMDADEPDKIIAMFQDGVTEEEFTIAIREMDEKGFTCSGISSARNWIINNRSSKKRQPGNSSGRAKPDLGDYKISRLSEVVIE